jgi:cell shape-determining protein MreC
VPIVGWLKTSIGFDNLVIYFVKLFTLSLKPIPAAADIVVDYADQFVRMEAENARLREVAKSSTEQLEKANKLATEAQKEAAGLKKELNPLKEKTKEEEQLKFEAQA